MSIDLAIEQPLGTTGQYIMDQDGNSSRLSLDSGGRVGIGTESPGGALHVVTSVNTDDDQPRFLSGSSTRGDTNEIILGADVAPYKASLIQYSNGEGTKEQSRLSIFHWSDSPETGINVLGGGNVGIGTANASSRLELGSGDLAFGDNSHRSGNIRLYKEPDTSDEYVSHGIGTEAYHNTYGAGTAYENRIGHKFYAGGGELIAQVGVGGEGAPEDRLDSRFGGNVSIGTMDPAPATRLHVYQDGDAEFGHINTASWHARFGSATGELRISGAHGQGASIQAASPENDVRALHLNPGGGKVRIGTPAPPRTALDVAGVVRADGLQIHGSFLTDRSNAPSEAVIETLVIDTITGTVYTQ